MPIIESGLERSKGTDPLDNSRDSTNAMKYRYLQMVQNRNFLSHLSVFQCSFNTDLENLGSIALILPLDIGILLYYIGELIK